MRILNLLSVSAVLASFALVGCASETATSSAPELDTDTLEGTDWGSSYNGWSISSDGLYDWVDGTVDLSIYFSRSYGDNTRGGGSCVISQTNGTCTSDANCSAYVSYNGGYGYCMNGSCWQRPGYASDLCYQNPNNAPGGYSKWAVNVPNTGRTLSAVNCLTKTAGPNTACGGTNGSLYMRSFGHVGN